MLSVELRREVGTIEVDVAFDVAPGETLALAGPSGCGKTTILRALAGLAHPDAGRVTCDGEVWTDTLRGIAVAPELRHCGYVFQDYALFGHLSAWRNVSYGLGAKRRAGRRAVAIEWLDRFGMVHLAESRPPDLSGGERQRIALVRALASGPRVLLLDEPLSALDVRTRAAATRVLTDTLRELEVPAVIVTHDYMQAALTADRIAVIDSGRIVQTGTAGELAATPATSFVADLTGANVLWGAARVRPDGLTEVALDGGGTVVSVDHGEGTVAAGVHPWEIELLPPSEGTAGSAQNHLAVEVTSVTAIGNRVRVGLAAPQPFVAEITGASLDRMQLSPGSRVTASWKAAATRLTGA